MHLGYIRAETADGAPLVARSILRSEEGVFFVKLEAVGFPSAIGASIGMAGGDNPGLVGMRPHHHPIQHYPVQQPTLAYSKFVQGLGYAAAGIETDYLAHPMGLQFGGGGTRYPTPQGSSDGGRGELELELGGGNEHALFTGDTDEEDVDAPGEVDGEVEFGKIEVQRRVMGELKVEVEGRRRRGGR